MKRLCACAVGVFAIIALPVSAGASEWWLTGYTGKRVQFTDRESVRDVSVLGSRYRSAWTNEYERDVDGKYKISTKSISVWECAEKKYAIRALILYDNSGRRKSSIDSKDHELEFSYLVPDTIGEANLMFVCNAEKGAGDTLEFEIGGALYFYVDDPDLAAARLAALPSSSAPEAPRSAGQ